MISSSRAIKRSRMGGTDRFVVRLASLATVLTGAVPLIAPSGAHAGDPGKEEARRYREQCKQAGAVDRQHYRAYYERFKPGPAFIPGHDTNWVPQGLTYWAARDALIISYYDSKGRRSRIAIVDRESGRHIKTLSTPNTSAG